MSEITRLQKHRQKLLEPGNEAALEDFCFRHRAACKKYVQKQLQTPEVEEAYKNKRAADKRKERMKKKEAKYEAARRESTVHPFPSASAKLKDFAKVNKALPHDIPQKISLLSSFAQTYGLEQRKSDRSE